MVGVGRQAVGEQPAQQELAHASTSLWRPECLLESCEVVRTLEHLCCARVELAEAIDDLGRRLPGVLLGGKKPSVQALEPAVDALVDLAEPSPEPLLDVVQS